MVECYNMRGAWRGNISRIIGKSMHICVVSADYSAIYGKYALLCPLHYQFAEKSLNEAMGRDLSLWTGRRCRVAIMHMLRVYHTRRRSA